MVACEVKKSKSDVQLLKFKFHLQLGEKNF